MAGQPGADATTFAPFIVHPIAPINFDTQIPKKGDQRQMEAWQRIGTYAAGLALESAGVKGNADELSHMDMIVAAGGGERDLTVDSTIMSGMKQAADPDAFLNERLMGDLRPTLFLAQLSRIVDLPCRLLVGSVLLARPTSCRPRSGRTQPKCSRHALSIVARRSSTTTTDRPSVRASKPTFLATETVGSSQKLAWRPTFLTCTCIGSRGSPSFKWEKNR